MIGKRWSNGRYEVTIIADADDCDAIADMFPHYDRGADEWREAAEAIREREAARNEGPGIGIRLVAIDRRPVGVADNQEAER